jgi:hypothetical protein
MVHKASAMDIRISKESAVPLRQQIAAQIEFQIATGQLKPGVQPFLYRMSPVPNTVRSVAEVLIA